MDTGFAGDGPLGVTLLGDGKARFRIWAPSEAAMLVEVDGAATEMTGADGWFHAVVPCKPGDCYNFRLPNGMAVPDPASRAQDGDVHGPSIVVNPAAYQWRRPGWTNRPWHEAVIYEAHVGLLGGFTAMRAHLPRLAALGVTAIELMPIADFPGGRNWGYDGVLPFAPDAAYGTPDELKALIDDAHGLELMVFLDVVYNHFGPDGAYLHVYARDFFDPDVHTPWGAAIDFTRKEVRGFFIGNALMWLNEYRFDGLRFDAVHAISPPGFLPELAEAIRAGAERPVHLILEHEGNKASLLRATPDGSGFDAQWADDFHHCLHVLLTGESEGYYEDFQDPARQLARALAEGFVYQGEVSPHHRAPRGEASGNLPPTAFVVCLQNHDQIGNRALGERLTALADPRALRAATAMLLLCPFIPMLFMGEEWGTRHPFLFFTDHNPELAALVRDGRRREFRHFAAFKDEARRAQIPDPNAAETYEAGRIDPAEAEQPPHDSILALHLQLLALRRAHVVPGIPGCRSLGAAAIGPAAICAAWRLGTGQVLTIASNFAADPVAFARPAGSLLFGDEPGADGSLPGRTSLVFLEQAQ
jgi:maltooligosyltrehalose trehalohydrolase